MVAALSKASFCLADKSQWINRGSTVNTNVILQDVLFAKYRCFHLGLQGCSFSCSTCLHAIWGICNLCVKSENLGEETDLSTRLLLVEMRFFGNELEPSGKGQEWFRKRLRVIYSLCPGSNVLRAITENPGP